MNSSRCCKNLVNKFNPIDTPWYNAVHEVLCFGHAHTRDSYAQIHTIKEDAYAKVKGGWRFLYAGFYTFPIPNSHRTNWRP